MSVRIFPKNQGAERYELSGIAGLCDWVVTSDPTPPHTQLRGQDLFARPRHVFLSLRSPFDAIRFFWEDVLPRIENDFVLVSGSEDVTLPAQTDHRWRPFDAQERAMIECIANHPRLLHWFAENIDAQFHPKISPLPTGMVDPQAEDELLTQVDPPPLSDRDLRAFCCHRARSGPQWDIRHRVSALAQGAWSDCCHYLAEGVSIAEYRQALRRHAFVICAEGGGLDPSPKAWEALLGGAIPILRRTATSQAYAELPVAFVDDWTDDSLSFTRLRDWADRLGPFYDDPALRAEVVEKLQIQHWWRKIEGRIG